MLTTISFTERVHQHIAANPDHKPATVFLHVKDASLPLPKNAETTVGKLHSHALSVIRAMKAAGVLMPEYAAKVPPKKAKTS